MLCAYATKVTKSQQRIGLGVLPPTHFRILESLHTFCSSAPLLSSSILDNAQLMRAWTNLLGLEAISLHLRRGAIFQAASSRTTCARHGPNGPSRLLPSVFPHLQQVAGLRTKSRPKAQPRLPYAKYVLPKKPTPQRVYPLKLKHSSKLAKDTDSDSGNANEWTWIDVSRSQSSTEELERELEWLANNNPSSPEIHDMFDELVEKRGSQPTTMHYEALILSNCNPQQGSVEKVEAILDELGKANIPVSASLYGAVLKVSGTLRDSLFLAHPSQVLAVHPECHPSTENRP